MWLLKNFAEVWAGCLVIGFLLLWLSLRATQPKPTECTTLTLAKLEDAIIAVESGGNPKAFNAHENACGAMQIRPCVIEDVNRILKHEAYSLSDRWDVGKSREIFRIYTDHYSDGSNESRARTWNGGPRGMKKGTTKKYWEKVRKHLHSN